MALLALILYTPTRTAPAPASAPATSQPRDLRDSPCVVVNRSKVKPRHCLVSRACSGSSGTTAAGRFQPTRIFLSCTHRHTAGSAPAPARLRTKSMPSHRSRSARPPRSESPLARSTSYALLRWFAQIVCTYIYTMEHAYARAYTCKRTCTCIRVSLRLFTRINAVSYVRLRACLHAELIKMQNAFARKIFQHANAL